MENLKRIRFRQINLISSHIRDIYSFKNHVEYCFSKQKSLYIHSFQKHGLQRQHNSESCFEFSFFVTPSLYELAVTQAKESIWVLDTVDSFSFHLTILPFLWAPVVAEGTVSPELFALCHSQETLTPSPFPKCLFKSVYR